MDFIKICGITTEEQGVKIAQLGATHIGMIHFEKSPRHIPLSKIQSIASSIKGKAKSVAVVVNPNKETVEKLLNIVDFIQLHGDEDIQFALQFPKDRVIKAFRIKDKGDITKIQPFYKEGFTVLIDAYSPTEYGGTGKRINPNLAKEVVSLFPKTVLSGGLSEENITEILKQVKPYGVDASSKLEIKPGLKDLQKVERFIKKVREFYGAGN
ncbi:MAG: phosphoribosylanthranilate isomerase [Aquificae bacterium]|nr:phosphoribosylanthranilate isomerase [Aquificota bacterium]